MCSAVEVWEDGGAGCSEEEEGVGTKDLKHPQSTQKIEKQIKTTSGFQPPDSSIFF